MTIDHFVYCELLASDEQPSVDDLGVEFILDVTPWGCDHKVSHNVLLASMGLWFMDSGPLLIRW